MTPTGGRATHSSPLGATTTYAYDYAQHTVSAMTTGDSMPQRFERTTTDGFGRTIKTEAGGSASSIVSVIDTQYGPCACSPLGKTLQVSLPHAPSETAVWTVHTYDASGRTLTATAPDGTSVTRYTYQGNTTTVTDAAGKWKTYVRDANGNLTRVIEPNPTGGTLTTDYTYDALNHLKTVTMTRGSTTQVRTFNYDSSTQRLTSVTTPEAGTVTYAYNADGTLLRKTTLWASAPNTATTRCSGPRRWTTSRPARSRQTLASRSAIITITGLSRSGEHVFTVSGG